MDKDHEMSVSEWQMFNHDKKLFNTLEPNRYYCKCGHSVLITPSQERAFCSWCHYWVYKDKTKQEIYEKEIQQREEKLKSYEFRKELMKRL